MSDLLTQKCDGGCGAVNSANDTSWVRVFGVTMGKSLQPIPVMQPRMAAQPSGRRMLDFCPNCKTKITVGQLPSIMVAKTQ